MKNEINKKDNNNALKRLKNKLYWGIPIEIIMIISLCFLIFLPKLEIKKIYLFFAFIPVGFLYGVSLNGSMSSKILNKLSKQMGKSAAQKLREFVDYNEENIPKKFHLKKLLNFYKHTSKLIIPGFIGSVFLFVLMFALSIINNILPLKINSYTLLFLLTLIFGMSIPTYIYKLINYKLTSELINNQ